MSEAATEAATAGATAATTADAGPATPAVRRTPARPVLSIALVMFVPAVVLVLDGNLSVQTALVRFVAALLVSWAAARLVWATVRAATSVAEAGGGDVAGAAPARGRAASERAAPERTGAEPTGTAPGMP
jgi:hypothetical protein